MGYTHYFSRVTAHAHRPLVSPTFAELSEDIRRILAHAQTQLQVPLAGPLGEGQPEITADHIGFNGVGNDGCETFWVEAGAVEEPFNFTKTRQRPYDVAVVAALVALHDRFPHHFSIGSDGEPRDWIPGFELACAALQRPLRFPPEIAGKDLALTREWEDRLNRAVIHAQEDALMLTQTLAEGEASSLAAEASGPSVRRPRL